MKRTGRYILQYLGIALIIGLLVFFTRDSWDEFSQIRSLSASSFLIVSLAFVVYQAAASAVLREFATVFDVRLSFRECFALVSLRSLGNYLPLSAGWTANALYLKQKKNFPIASFTALMAGNFVLMLLTAGLIGIAVLAAHALTTGSFQVVLWVLYLLVVIATIAMLRIPIPSIKRADKLGRILKNMHEGWQMIRTNRRVLYSVTALHALSQAAAAVQFVVVFRALEIDISFSAILILSISTTITQFASILPGNLGLREAVAGAVGAAFGVTFVTGLLAATVTRAVNMALIFVLGAFCGVAFGWTKRS